MSNDIIVMEEILGYVLEALDVIEVSYELTGTVTTPQRNTATTAQLPLPPPTHGPMVGCASVLR